MKFKKLRSRFKKKPVLVTAVSILAIGIVIALAMGAYCYFYHLAPQQPVVQYQTKEEAQNIYVRFDMEAYDKIQQNYWAATSTYDLAHLFQLSLAKVTHGDPTLATDDRNGLAAMLYAAIATTTNAATEKEVAVDTLTVALYNLQPAGRDVLDSSQQVVAMRQLVSNVNPATDLYGNLGVSASSSPAVVKLAYQKQEAALKNATSSDDKAKAVQAAYAYKVLSDVHTKSLYDSAQIQPTISSRIIGHTFYIYMSKMSPTSVEELAWAVDAASTTPSVNTMIIDLRGNIGGALADAQAMAGIFLGADQYAFDLFHQGDRQVQRTLFQKFGELDRYTQIAVLTDSLTQSTAEVTTQMLKHFNIAKSVGTTTRGWGTVENTYPMQTVIDPTTAYVLELVNSLTLRDDNIPIEGRGIPPDVDVTQAGWKTKLTSTFSSPSLVRAVESAIADGPFK